MLLTDPFLSLSLSYPPSRLYLNYSHSEHDREFYFLVVLTSRQSEQTLRNSVAHICYKALLRRIINVVVLTLRSEEQEKAEGVGLTLYAYKLYDEHCVPHINAYESNRLLANGELNRPELFPLRFTNLTNCALNVTGHQMPPHFMYRPANGVPLPVGGAFIDTRDLRGIDGELLRLLATVLRFRVRLIIPEGKSGIFSADSINGCFAHVSRLRNRQVLSDKQIIDHFSYRLFNEKIVKVCSFLLFVISLPIDYSQRNR